MSVAQLEQMLAGDLAAHRQDADIAKKVAGIEISERISQTTLARLEAQISADPLASRALQILADRSQFLDLPASESVADPAPEIAEQMRMLDNSQNYVAQTLRGLPNFLAKRTINLYDDTPQAMKQGEWPMRAGLHLMGTSSAEISVSREREDQPGEQGSAVWQSRTGLLSGGEFGTTLGMILTDAAKGEIKWSHWEHGPAEQLAVYRYSVPASASHFELISSYQREASVEGVRGPANERGVSGIGIRPNVSPSNVEVVRSRPAYRGSIWIDPAGGAIYRVTIEADISKGLPFRQAAMLVEYGPVNVAGSRFICPVRSLALSESVATAESYSSNSATMWLNETLFTDYHRFASSSRMVEEAGNAGAPNTAPATQEQADANAAPAPPKDAASSALAQDSKSIAPSSNQGQAAAPAGPPVEPASSVQVPASSPPSNATSPAPESPAKAPPAPGSAASNINQPPAPAPEDNGFRIKVEVSSLLVPVVVLDKKGQSVAGLGQEDFTVEDDGKPRTIVGFTAVKNAPNASAGNSDGSNGPAADGSAQEIAGRTSGPAPSTRHLIFLFDDRHMTTAELPLVQRAAVHLLERPLPETDDAIVLSFEGVNSGFTRDRALLQSAIMKLVVHPMYQHAKEDCPDVDYYSGDQIIAKHNAMEFQIAVQKARQCSMSQDLVKPSPNLYSGMDNASNPFQLAAMAAARHAVAIGEEDARQSLLSVRDVVRVLAKVPGRYTLILVSPGFLTLSPETMLLKSEIMNLAAASDVTVNTLDARGLYAGNLDASEGGSTSTLGLVSGQNVQDHLASMEANENVMSELAAGTGGKFFHNNNDLQGGMAALAAAPENLYLLEVSLKEVKLNGAYHRLQVKVNRPGVEVLGRKGFVASKPAAGTK